MSGVKGLLLNDGRLFGIPFASGEAAGVAKGISQSASTLSKLGISEDAGVALQNGKVIHSQFTTKAGAEVDAFYQFQNGKLTAQVFYMTSNGNSGAGAGALIQFRSGVKALAKTLSAETIEFQGGSVINADVEAWLNGLGFKVKTVPVPPELGGGMQEVYFLEVELK